MRLTILLLLAGTVGAAETAVHNITGYTSTNTGIHEFTVLVVSDDGKVVATGGVDILSEYPDAVLVDGQGRSLLPGLTDAHAHVYGLGFLNVSLDLAGTQSLEAAVANISEYSVANPDAD